MTATTQLWKAVRKDEECNRPILPKVLIEALRGALEAGMSCEQIAAAVHLLVGLDEMERGMDGEELVGRCREIGRTMVGWDEIKEARKSLSRSLCKGRE